MVTNYQKDLQSAKDKLAELLINKEHIEVQIARQKRRVAALAELCNADEASESEADLDLGGLTEACTTVLRGTRKEWLNTAEILMALKELGFQLGHYKAPIASITTTVNRLVEDGVVVAEKRPGDATEYKWVGKVPVLADYATAGKVLREMELQAKAQMPKFGASDPLNRNRPRAPVPPPAMRKKLGLP
jgi:hypothetical protein